MMQKRKKVAAKIFSTQNFFQIISQNRVVEKIVIAFMTQMVSNI